MKEPKKYFQLTQKEDTADLYIFGDIEKWAYEPAGEQSGVTIVNQLKALKATSINVHINSYGGDVSEGLAIYNTLREHPAQITTICDGFACSAASVVFMAGDKRVMSPASLLMIHNAWTIAMGNASALRKTADDIETITQASVEAYKRTATISEEEIKALMDAETWILPKDAVEYGFATEIDDEDDDDEPKQSAFGVIMQKLISVPASLECETAPMEIAEDSIKALADRISGKLLEKLMEPDTPAAKKSGWDTYFK